MTRIPLVPVYPSFLFIFQEEKIIAEIKKWNSKYCILISDSCFQCLYADRKFWSRRYLFPHLCIRISDNTGYPDREFFFLIQEERDSFKELIAKKDQLNRMQRSVAKTFQEVLELTGSLCFMFRSTPSIGSKNWAPSICKKKMVDPHHVFKPKAKVHVQKIRSRSFSQLHLVATSSSMLHRWSQMLPSKIRDNIKYPESIGQGNNWSGLLQCPMGTLTRSATWYLCRYPTRLIFEDNQVADNLNFWIFQVNLKFWVVRNISGIPTHDWEFQV